MFYDREGNKITADKCEAYLRDDDYKVLKQEYVEDYFVSTIWLGLDHGFRSMVPIIFETMIFPRENQCKDWSGDFYQERYATEEEALEGHKIAIKWLEDKLKEEGNGKNILLGK